MTRTQETHLNLNTARSLMLRMAQDIEESISRSRGDTVSPHHLDASKEILSRLESLRSFFDGDAEYRAWEQKQYDKAQ